MIKIASTYLSYGDFYKIFESLKTGGLVKVSETLGIKIEHHNGKYAEISLVALGGIIDEKVYFEKMSSFKPRKIKPVKEEPKNIVTEVKGNFAGETDLFGDING